MEDFTFVVSEIIPNKLYLSGIYPIFRDLDKLKNMKITHILSITDNAKPTDIEINNFIVHHIQLKDDIIGVDIYKYFNSTNTLINDILKKNNNKLLVHCAAGASRSATLIISHLMNNGMTMDNALAYVKKCRSIVNPNISFIKQLREYEKHIQQR